MTRTGIATAHGWKRKDGQRFGEKERMGLQREEKSPGDGRDLYIDVFSFTLDLVRERVHIWGHKREGYLSLEIMFWVVGTPRRAETSHSECKSPFEPAIFRAFSRL